MTLELVATVGLPASGKSTWAREQSGYCRINRDSIRTMAWNEPWSGEQEKLTVAMRDALIAVMLLVGKSVIVDDTNLSGELDTLAVVAKTCGADFRVQDFTDVPVETCIERDQARVSGHVGEDVIRRFAAKLP